MSKLQEYLEHSTFPIVRTGFAYSESQLLNLKVRRGVEDYHCSLCDERIGPNDRFRLHIENEFTKTITFNGKEVLDYEIIGFICGKCEDVITYYDNLYYG